MLWKFFPMLPVFALFAATLLVGSNQSGFDAEEEGTFVEEVVEEGSRIGFITFVTIGSMAVFWMIYQLRRREDLDETHGSFDLERLAQLDPNLARSALATVEDHDLSLALNGASEALKSGAFALLPDERVASCRVLLTEDADRETIRAARRKVEEAVRRHVETD